MDEPKQILYRGILMIEGWPQKIKRAQELQTLSLGGKATPRVRYGDEQSDWDAEKQACGDCSVILGEFHVPSCDVEECPACGGQLISCDCPFDEVEKEL